MKYYGFTPKQVGTAVFGLEKIADMKDELEVLHREHWQETETNYLDVDCDPDYDRWVESEANTQFVVFTARIAGKMIGYVQYYVFRDMHSQGMYTAREDAFFLTKSQRGRGYAPEMLKFAEHCLKQLGCRYVGMSSKGPSGGPEIGPFLERQGYKPVATYYVKNLEAEENVLQRPTAAA